MLVNKYFGKSFPSGGFSATLSEGDLLGTLPCGLEWVQGTAFGIPSFFQSILFLLLSLSGVDASYDLQVSALDFRTALYHHLVKVFCTHTCCLGRGCSSFLP